MSLEEGLGCGDILNADNAVCIHFDDLVDEKEGVAMRQDVADLVNVQDGHAVTLIIAMRGKENSVPLNFVDKLWLAPARTGSFHDLHE